MLKLKGIIYLPACKTKDNPKATDTFILSSAKKEYVLSSLSANPTADILSWRNSLDFAIEQSQQYVADPVISGWLMKKGGKGHTYQNWKKRWFVLRGTCMFYYEDKEEEMEKRGWASMEKLKGFIEISRITDIDADDGAGDGIYDRTKGGDELVLGGSGGFGATDKTTQSGPSSSISSYPNAFEVTVNNDKSYFFASKSYDEKLNWISALRTRIQRLASNALQMSLNTCNGEQYVRSGEMKRHVDAKRAKSNFFVLTNLNLRVYATKPDLANLSASWGKGMIACVPLLGCSVHSSDDSDEWDLKPNELALIEIQGHAYVLETMNAAERAEWVAALKAQARLLAKSVVSAGETIRLTCNASDKNDHNAGYTILNVNRDQLQLKYLMLKKIVVIPFDRLKLVYVLPGFLFCLKYMQGSKAKQLKMKCGNANGIFDAVEAIFELHAVGAHSGDPSTSSPSSSTPNHGTPSIEMNRQRNEKLLYHPSVAINEIEAHTNMQHSGRTQRMTRELLFNQRESEEEAANLAAVNSTVVSSSFSDFHYMAAPSSSARVPREDRSARYSTRVDLPSQPPAPSNDPTPTNTIQERDSSGDSSPSPPAEDGKRRRQRTTRSSAAPELSEVPVATKPKMRSPNDAQSREEWAARTKHRQPPRPDKEEGVTRVSTSRRGPTSSSEEEQEEVHDTIQEE